MGRAAACPRIPVSRACTGRLQSPPLRKRGLCTLPRNATETPTNPIRGEIRYPYISLLQTFSERPQSPLPTGSCISVLQLAQGPQRSCLPSEEHSPLAPPFCRFAQESPGPQLPLREAASCPCIPKTQISQETLNPCFPDPVLEELAAYPAPASYSLFRNVPEPPLLPRRTIAHPCIPEAHLQGISSSPCTPSPCISVLQTFPGVPQRAWLP